MANSGLFTDAELEGVIDEISELLGKESFVLKKTSVALLNKSIQLFFNRLTDIENKLIKDFNLSTSLLEQEQNLKTYSHSLNQKIKKNNSYKTILQAQLKEVFTYGYMLVMRIRELMLNEEIKYSVAYKRGNTSFEVSEEAILKRARLSLSSMEISIKNGRIELDVIEKISVGKRLQQDAIEGTISSNLKGSTKWSRGLAILEALQSRPEISGGKKGLNFGHFYEAYMYFSKNNASNTPPDPPDAVTYASYMLALRNPTKFYGGGDYEDYQLKANEATLTHLRTIKNQLLNIQTILNTQQTLKQKTAAIKQSYIAAGGKKDVDIAASAEAEKIAEDKLLSNLLSNI